MRFNMIIPQRSIVLSVREAEHAVGAVHAAIDRSELMCRLESGECVAKDGASEDPHAGAPVVCGEASTVDGARARPRGARRDQADRRTSVRRALEAHERGRPIAFRRTFTRD